MRDAIDNPDRGFRAQIAKGVTDDGLWYEGSLGYHSYTMDALWPLAEAARHAGIDLYTDRMRSLWDAPLALAFPNGDPPGFNDNGGANVDRLGNLYEVGYARWQRPEYGRVAARSPRRNLQALLYGAENRAGRPDGPGGKPAARSFGLRHAEIDGRGGGDALRHARRRPRPPRQTESGHLGLGAHVGTRPGVDQLRSPIA